MSRSISLTITNCPNNELAKTNHVFASDKERWAGSVKFLEINGLVFTVSHHAEVAAGQLGLNSVQRRLIRASTGDTVSVGAFQPPPSAFEAVLLNGEVEPVSKAKLRPGTAVELNAMELSAHLQSRYVGQVLRVEQSFMFEFQGTNYILKINNVVVTDKANEQVPVERGMLTAKTAFIFEVAAGGGVTIKGQRSVAAPQLFRARDLNFERLGIGGLDEQFGEIFRRAFQSRVLPPALAERLGVPHVKGMLLFGPPGTGKTLIARQIGKMLNSKEPKIVNGPEILNKYVGASEENVRELFKDAEREQAERGDASDLHVIIFDEIDAICKQRGSVGSGTGVHDTVVNQLLTKIDGVDALNNILLIGMTNRKDMLDDALLRPGRLEVQVEIGLPDESGRLQILKIHTNKMLENSFLAQDVDLASLSARTKNFSGAEIQGLVKSAISWALNRQIDVNDLSKTVDEENLRVTMADFEKALKEVKPAFGAVTDMLEAFRANGTIDCGPRMRQLKATCEMLVSRVQTSDQTDLLTCLLEGPPGSGKTALAATLAIESGFPFVKVISSANMMGFSEAAKAAQITRTIEDAYRSPLSMVILDNLERLFEYVPIGPRFSNQLLQIVLELLARPPPRGRKLLVVGTSGDASVLSDLGALRAFNMAFHVPALGEAEVRQVFVATRAFQAHEVDMAVASLLEPEVPIKRLLLLLDLAREGIPAGSPIPVPRWQQVIRDFAT